VLHAGVDEGQHVGDAHIVMNSRDRGADLTLARRVHRSESWAYRAVASGGGVDKRAELCASTSLEVDVAAANGFVNGIVAPSQTRERLVQALELHA
jgi:hypothetical protein